MRKTVNKETISGRVYDHNLALKKVQNEKSDNFGKDFINGTLDIATDEAGLNVVTVHFTYVTPMTKAGAENKTFTALKKIIEGGKTVVADGIENATLVTVNTSIGLNDFYTDRDGEEKLVSSQRNDGGFVTIVNKLEDESKRNTFEFDILINGTEYVEANEEKNIPADFLYVKGAVFNFAGKMLPIKLVVDSAGGMKYFESLEASSKNLVFTKVWGNIKSRTIVTKKEEEVAFGEPVVREYSRSIKEWVITRAAKEAYEIGDAENGITTEEIQEKMATRETDLADVKKRQDEYRASQAAGGNAAAAPAVAAGSFNF